MQASQPPKASSQKRVIAQPPGKNTITPSASGGEAANTVKNRNKWYQDFSGKAMSTSIISGTTNILLIGIVAGLLIFRPEPVYFAAEDGRVTPIIPVSQAISTDIEVVNWAVKAVTETLSIDFVNYMDQLTAVERYFTPQGYQAYLVALRDSGNLDSIRQNRYIARAVPTSFDRGGPRITGRVTRGALMYQLEIPLLVSYHGAERGPTQQLRATVLVTRVPQSQNREGLAIQQLVLGSAR